MTVRIRVRVEEPKAEPVEEEEPPPGNRDRHAGGRASAAGYAEAGGDEAGEVVLNDYCGTSKAMQVRMNCF